MNNKRPGAKGPSGAHTILLLLLLATLPGCSQPQARPKLVIDYAHGEIFMPLDVRPLGYSSFDGLFQEAGYETAVVTEPLTTGDLKDADVYLLAGPMVELGEDEEKVVRDFVEQGGKVIVLVHISKPLERFLAAYNISFGWVIAEDENRLDGPHDFRVMDMGEASFLEGVDTLGFYGAFSVKAPAEYAHTTSGAWEDYDMDGALDEGEPKGRKALIGLAEQGRGSVLVIGDDAVLANAFIDREDNRRFARNLVAWSKG